MIVDGSGLDCEVGYSPTTNAAFGFAPLPPTYMTYLVIVMLVSMAAMGVNVQSVLSWAASIRWVAPRPGWLLVNVQAVSASYHFQPGGWFYNILPYIEQQAMHDMGAGLPPWGQPGTAKGLAHIQRASIPLTVLYCPTRRPALVYPWTTYYSTSFINANTPTLVMRSDYAGNSGTVYVRSGSAPNTWTTAPPGPDAGPTDVYQVESPPGTMTVAARNAFIYVNTYSTGIFHCGSMVKMAEITDGTSNTYMIGEKYVMPDWYATGMDPGDNESALSGDNADIVRWCDTVPFPTPYQDTPGLSGQTSYSFGSAHAIGFFMAFCDGSVQKMNYSIANQVHSRLGNRKDGYAIDGKKY